MQKNIKKRGAIASAAIAIAFFAVYLGAILFAAVSENFGNLAAVLLVLVFICIIAAAIFGIIAVLRQRLREIDSGEEEDAKQY